MSTEQTETEPVDFAAVKARHEGHGEGSEVECAWEDWAEKAGHCLPYRLADLALKYKERGDLRAEGERRANASASTAIRRFRAAEALVLDLQGKVARVEAELHHAEDNEHMLMPGQGLMRLEPGVRISYVRDALADRPEPESYGRSR